MAPIVVNSPNVVYTADNIEAKYCYESVQVEKNPVSGVVNATIMNRIFELKTQRKVPKTGLMMVGIGGNNGTTVTAGIIANKRKLEWETKEGRHSANWYGSMTMSSTMKLGIDPGSLRDVFVPLSDVLPMSRPEDWVVGGWDISDAKLGDAMKRAKVLDIDLQKQVYEELQKITPLPGIYEEDFIAANQSGRANNLIKGSKSEQIATIRGHIQEFKKANGLDKVIILWTANTERYTDLVEGVNDTHANLLEAIKRNEAEIAPSTLYAVASILEGCSYINGSPQNTFVPAVIEMAVHHGVFLGGDDFKSGQTKMKSVLVDFLVSAGLKPTSIVSYNHLGNNDGKNLSSPSQFRSKEISKSNVVDDMVSSNQILFRPDEKPDHVVVIKYVPSVGDSKRALDEFTSEIFLGGKNTIVIHNTCEDSLLAAPLIIDLVVLTELFERVVMRAEGDGEYERMHSVLSILSYLCKAPIVPSGTPVKNALFAQRECITNTLRACIGLPPDNHMLLDHKLQTAGVEVHGSPRCSYC